MKTFEVLVTRDCRFTQSGFVQVKANSRDEALAAALEVRQEMVEWVDDDSFHCGESGTYIADEGDFNPEEVKE